MPRKSMAIAIVALAAAASFVPASTVLVNPSFESQSGFVGGPGPFVDTTTITGWRLTGVGDGGNFSQILGVDNGAATGKDGNNFAYNVRGVFETLDADRPEVTAGTTYIFSFLAEADFNNLPTNVVFSIDWYSSQSGYTPLSSTSELITVLELGAFQNYSISGVAPAGATFAAVKFDTTIASVGGTGSNIWFDAASLTAIPLPTSSTMALAATTAALLRRRR